MLKFFFDPDNNNIIFSNGLHAIAYHKNKSLQKKPFDTYIRGIIADNTLYLRTYYPFENINEQSYNYILNASKILLKNYLEVIKKALKKDNITVKYININCSNEQLQSALNVRSI